MKTRTKSLSSKSTCSSSWTKITSSGGEGGSVNRSHDEVDSSATTLGRPDHVEDRCRARGFTESEAPFLTRFLVQCCIQAARCSYGARHEGLPRGLCRAADVCLQSSIHSGPTALIVNNSMHLLVELSSTVNAANAAWTGKSRWELLVTQPE